MKTQQFQEISISTLCKRAGISRMAFYRNYDSKEAVLVDHFDHYVRRFMNY
ncbi:TetR/AcrR family transcriptional regulator [Loigolactobacillus iwatensis]|uniref:TetR/AcrR family transcriptional regulator n=1 Tax=Loigolactobacillus iwatensis TaxID=1267156 RepID=UPI001CDBD780